MGCLWASYWRQSGAAVVLITPNERSQKFIEVTTANRTTRTTIDSITIKQLQTSNIHIEQLLVSTKAQQTQSAVVAIKGHIASDAIVLVLQNGMAIKQLPAILPSQHLLAAITTDGAYRTGPQSVVHAGVGVTYIGGSQADLAILPTHYLNIKLCEDIEQKQWLKLGINCAINGLTAIHQCRNGELLNKPEAMEKIRRLCNEIIAIAAASSVSAPFAQLYQQVEATLHTTAQNYSSMYQDIANSRKTEIDFVNGYICELADLHRVYCDENRSIVNAIKTMEQSFH